jgi:hypothetical protein
MSRFFRPYRRDSSTRPYSPSREVFGCSSCPTRSPSPALPRIRHDIRRRSHSDRNVAIQILEDEMFQKMRRLNNETEGEALKRLGRTLLAAHYPGGPSRWGTLSLSSYRGTTPPRGHYTRSPSRSRASRSHSRTPRGRRQSRSFEPFVPKPQEIFTTFGPYARHKDITSSPLYTRIEIPPPYPSTFLPEPATIFHAVHPVPRRYLRQLIKYDYDTTQLRFIGEFLDEELYPMTEMNELAEKMQETVHRVNELLGQKGEEMVGMSLWASGEDRAKRDE